MVRRFRVFFEDHRLLNNSQLSHGLGRCWALLKPSIVTFADLASYLRDKFDIRDPLVLFIDDFVLPPFESTRILKDTDIIRVKLNAKAKDALLRCDGQNIVHDPQIASPNGLPLNSNIMADEKSQANSQGNGNNENTVQKRESSLELHNSARKKQRLNFTEEQVPSAGIQDTHSRQNRTLCQSSGGSKMELPAKDYTHDDGSVVALSFSEVSLGEPSSSELSLGEPSSSMSCKGRKQFEGISNASEPHIACDVPKSHHNLLKICNRKPEGDSPGNKAKAAEHKIDFATLFPLTRSPLRGDILAYRYVEPSSTVYPVLSSPQVGKVSAFDFRSSEIVLAPSPEFEVFLEEYPKMPILTQTLSPYKEDGSLEIKLSSLIDVRLLKAHNSKELACLPEGTFNRTKKDKWERALAKSNCNSSDPHHTDQKIEWDSWLPNHNSNNILPRGRANGGNYTANERRASTPWFYGTSPAAALFWETVQSKGTFGKGAICSTSGKY